MAQNPYELVLAKAGHDRQEIEGHPVAEHGCGL